MSVASLDLPHDETDDTAILLKDLNHITTDDNRHIVNAAISLLLKTLAPTTIPLLPRDCLDASRDVDDLICNYHGRILTFRQQIKVLKHVIHLIVDTIQPVPPGRIIMWERNCYYAYSKTESVLHDNVFLVIFLNNEYIDPPEISICSNQMRVIVEGCELVLNMGPFERYRETNIKKFVASASRFIINYVNRLTPYLSPIVEK
jgi:hypothetical protein